MKLSITTVFSNSGLSRFMARNPKLALEAGKNPQLEEQLSQTTQPRALTIKPTDGQLRAKASLFPSRGFHVSISTSDFVTQRLADRYETSPDYSKNLAKSNSINQPKQSLHSQLDNAVFLSRNPDLLENKAIQEKVSSTTELDIRSDLVEKAKQAVGSAILSSQLELDAAHPETAQFIAHNLGKLSTALQTDSTTQLALADGTDAITSILAGVLAQEAASYFEDTPETSLTKDFFTAHPYASLGLLEDDNLRNELANTMTTNQLNKQQEFAATISDYETEQQAGAIARVRACLGDAHYFSEKHYYSTYYDEETQTELKDSETLFSIYNDYATPHEGLDSFTIMVDLMTRTENQGLLQEKPLNISSSLALSDSMTINAARTVNLDEKLKDAVAEEAARVLPSTVHLDTDFFKRNTGIAMAIVAIPSVRDEFEKDADRINSFFALQEPKSGSLESLLAERRDVATAHQAILAYTTGLLERNPLDDKLIDLHNAHLKS